MPGTLHGFCVRIALVAPSPVPFNPGGAENLWLGWLTAMSGRAGVAADLIKLPSAEADFWSIVDGYRRFAALDLSHFDRVISTKYPAWMVAHGDHHVFLQHKLRGLYDTWPAGLSTEPPAVDSEPLRRILAILAAARGARGALPEIFGELEELRGAAADLPPSLFSLPGALLRRVIHALDDIGLARTAIRRYAAISATVAAREGYFPAAVDATREVEVIHHPTIGREATGESVIPPGAIFSASRLDAAKRMDWLIAAHARAGIATPLYIAGEGPQLGELATAAEAAGNVVLLGRLSDAQLARAYEQAGFVAYVPFQEDYGLITLEALQAGRPVLTCSDTGGVTELVRDGDNGLVTSPDIDALAAGMRRLATDGTLREQLASRAAASVAHITWDRLVDAFTRSRPRIAVVNTFAMYPAESGGQLRMFHLYRELARRADVVCVSLVGAGERAGEVELAPGLRERRVPMTAGHAAHERDLARRLNASCVDIAAMLAPDLTPGWVEAARQAAAAADLLILSHPYGWPAVRDVAPRCTVYEAHNVETDLKRAILGTGAAELDRVAAVERECARAAARVICCSGENAARMQALFELPAPPAVVANGVDAASYPALGTDARQRARQRLGLDDRPVALFVGSLHGPNIEAAEHLTACAAAAPDILFCLLGSVCDAPGLEHAAAAGRLPANFWRVGRVSDAELRVWLGVADAGLNPVTSGSGTNLKILEYAAAGLPILTTPFGARGAPLEAGRHYVAAEPADFPGALEQMLAPAAREERSLRSESARQRAREAGDWRRIADELWEALGPLLCD